jgi:tetratricopeptide (TPR) repeat protein
MPPKRPREHQLEKESRTAFQTRLPSQWDFQDIPQPEYGLDGRVEIFDKADLATGRMFFVQLKATDKPELKDALAVQIEIPTCEYYRSLDLPVLIVRYHAPTGKIYVKWFHEYDPYYGKKAQKKITFRFTVENEWHEETAATLASDLEAFRNLKSPHLTPPVKFTLMLKEQHLHGVLAAQIELEIRKAAGRLSGVITISQFLPTDAHGSIVIANDKAEIYLKSGSGFTLHTSKSEVQLSQFPYDILVGIALALDNAGHFNLAARVFSEYAASSSIIVKPEIALIGVGCMIRGHRVIEALQLSERLSESEGTLLAAEMFTWTALSQNNSLSESEHQYLKNFLERYTEQAVLSGDRQRGAATQYNLGNYLSSRSYKAKNYRRLALHHYKKAANYNSAYLEKPYFCRELAGILFESKRYSLAVKFSERALSLGEEGVCRALYADALMFAGRYQESQQAFYAYLSSSPVFELDSEWRLKACVLSWIRSMLECDEQKRQTETAIELARLNNHLASHAVEYRQLLQDALAQDALCSYAWFNLGILESQIGNQENAFVPFLMAALIEKDDTEAWCHAIAIGIFQEYHALLSDMIAVAYQVNGESLMEELLRLVQNQPEGFPITKFLDGMNEILSKIPREEKRFYVRLYENNSDFHVLNF